MEDHVEKSGGDKPSPGTNTAERDGGADDPSTVTNIVDTDGKADDSGTGIVTAVAEREADPGINIDITNTDRRADPGISTDTANADARADNTGTGTDTADPDINGGADPDIAIKIAEVDVDGGADNPGTGTADINGGADNPGTGTGTTKADRQVAASDKVHMSLTSLYKALFFISSTELETISASLLSLFVFTSSPMTSVKRRAFSSKYSMAEIYIFSLNKASSPISSMLMSLKFFAKYSQFWVVSFFYLSLMTLDRRLLRQE